MKRLIVLSLLIILAMPASADTYEYGNFYLHGEGISAAGNTISVRCLPKTTDGYDYEYRWSVTSIRVNLAIYNVNGVDGWNGETGFYKEDMRSPMTAGQVRVIDRIYLWAGTGISPQNILLDSGPGYMDPELTYKLVLVSVPQGVYYDGPMEWGLGHDPITLPFYSSADGTTGYRFRMEFTAVPEPCSLLALVGGLVGFGGLALRRRRA